MAAITNPVQCRPENHQRMRVKQDDGCDNDKPAPNSGSNHFFENEPTMNYPAAAPLRCQKNIIGAGLGSL